MIYSRLKLSRNLLNDEGVIFCSIDDYEYDNFKKTLDKKINACILKSNRNDKNKTQINKNGMSLSF